MTINMGTVDRLLRLIVGVILLLMTPTIGGILGNPLGVETLWGWIGIIPLLTAVVGSCPVYSLLGISTK